MYHTLSEWLFTFSVALVELKIKATFFIWLHLVKIILWVIFFIYFSISQLHFNFLSLKRQKKRYVFQNTESWQGTIFISTKLLSFFLINICIDVYIWGAIKFSQFSSFSHMHSRLVIIWQLINIHLPNHCIITAISSGLSVSLSAIV